MSTSEQQIVRVVYQELRKLKLGLGQPAAGQSLFKRLLRRPAWSAPADHEQGASLFDGPSGCCRAFCWGVAESHAPNIPEGCNSGHAISLYRRRPSPLCPIAC